MNSVDKIALETSKKICQDFANKHELIFRKEGEVGFGRSCVGFLAGNDAYVDYNPTKAVYRGADLNPFSFEPVEEFCKVDLSPPHEVEDAYHKHDCLAVLYYGEDNSEAIHQLAHWVRYMEASAKNANSELFVKKYNNGYRGMQALFNGGYSYAIGVK